jgi:hypothetical protein
MNSAIFAVLVWQTRNGVSAFLGETTGLAVAYGIMLVVAAALIPVLSRLASATASDRP